MSTHPSLKVLLVNNRQETTPLPESLGDIGELYLRSLREARAKVHVTLEKRLQEIVKNKTEIQEIKALTDQEETMFNQVILILQEIQPYLKRLDSNVDLERQVLQKLDAKLE